MISYSDLKYCIVYYLDVQNTEGNTNPDSQQPTADPDNQHQAQSDTPSRTHANNIENTPTTSTQPSSSSSTSSAFKHRSTKYRSLAQAEKSISYSPRKRIEILAYKHQKIKFNNKGGGTKQSLLKVEEEWLFSFLDCPDISHQTPGRKDYVYIRKVDGKKQYVQKRYLQWTIRELLGIINENVPIEEIPKFTESFQRELTFRQLYDFLKRRKQYKYSNQTPHESCTCEICEDVNLLTSVVNRKLKNVDSKLPASVKKTVREYSCDVANENCMKSVFPECPSLTITDSDFKDSSSSSSNSDDSSSADSDEEDENGIKYYQ